MKSFIFNYRKFIYKSKRVYYGVMISESFFVALIIGLLFFKDNEKDLVLFVLIPCILTPVGIWFAGGFKYIQSKYLEKNNLKMEDL